jgi:hypothetical protein
VSRSRRGFWLAYRFYTFCMFVLSVSYRAQKRAPGPSPARLTSSNRIHSAISGLDPFVCGYCYWTTSRPTAVFNWLAALKYAPTRLM